MRRYVQGQRRRSVSPMTYLLVGDMRMRTMHSILYALSQFDAKAIVDAGFSLWRL